MTTTAPALDPSVPHVEDAPPTPAVLEVLDRHKGEKHGRNTILLPNLVRINGIPLWCPTDNPIVVQDIRVDGREGSPLVVNIRLQVRALRIGEAPSQRAVDVADDRTRYATVELPNVPDHLVDGSTEPDALPCGYAIVDGQKLMLADNATVDYVVPFGDRAVVVDLPLVCRSVVFDDESSDIRTL